MRVPTSCTFYSSLSFQHCLGIWEQLYNLKLSASYKFSFFLYFLFILDATFIWNVLSLIYKSYSFWCYHDSWCMMHVMLGGADACRAVAQKSCRACRLGGIQTSRWWLAIIYVAHFPSILSWCSVYTFLCISSRLKKKGEAWLLFRDVGALFKRKIWYLGKGNLFLCPLLTPKLIWTIGWSL
jgi:hypothetical protein